MIIMIAATITLSTKEKPFSRPFVFLIANFPSAEQLANDFNDGAGAFKAPVVCSAHWVDTGYTRSAYAYS